MYDFQKAPTANFIKLLFAGPLRCRPSALRAAQALCRPAPSQGVIQRQHLFTAYTHPPPAFGSVALPAARLPADLGFEVRFGCSMPVACSWLLTLS